MRKETNFGPDFYIYILKHDPSLFGEAMISPNATFWKEELNNEIESILANHTWELVDLPPGTKPFGCK